MIGSLRGLVTILFCTSLSLLGGLEYSPWFSRIYEIHPEIAYRGQGYREIASGDGDCHYPSSDQFVTASTTLTFSQMWNGGVAFTLAKTPRRSFGLSDVELLVRYQLSDDVIGDFVSSTVGVTALYNFPQSRRDLSLFNHGSGGGELHFTVGREWSQGSLWVGRLWGLVAFGATNVGSPWWRSLLMGEINSDNRYQAALFLTALHGLGDCPLHLCHFRGYGPVGYRVIGLGTRFRYYWDDGSFLTFCYQHRLVAHQAPKDVDEVTLAFCYPFGL